jgi:signal transduction histidine kinase/CheY-like chemotaxis protein
LLAHPYTRKALIGLAALMLTLLLTQSGLFRRFDNDMADVQARALAQPQNFDGVLVVDVDEQSMALLQPLLGAWPYRRDVYAATTTFLQASGAKSIAYDIVFSEPRAGDDDFAKALAKSNNVVLAASALDYPFERSPQYFAQIDALKWPSTADNPLPGLAWHDLTLPLPQFTRPDSAAQVGIISLKPDGEDGVHRRVPLLHHAYGRTLPSLSLAALHAGRSASDIKITYNNQILKIDGQSIKVNAQGEALLQFPANPQAFKVLPFYQLMHAAFNVPARPELDYAGPESVAAMIKDKRIFIGSRSAVLNDFVATPVEAKYPGLFMLALANQSLEKNLILTPRKPWLDFLLILLAIAVPLILFEQRARRSAAYSFIPLLLMGGLIIAVSCGLYYSKQSSAMFFPLLAGLITYLMLLVMRGLSLYLEKQKLTYEKMAAEEAYELKTRFMSHMTHELRTPLTAIIGFNKLLDDKKLDATTHSQYTRLVDKNSHHLLSLINNILDQSRIEAGQMKITSSPTAIKDVVEDVASTLSALAREKNLELKTVYTEPLPAAFMLDGFRLRQILINLAGNAVKFTERGSVTMRTSWQDNTLRIEVIDTGPGLNEEALQRIFTAFEQADANVAKTHGGSGLGLTISKNLVQLMNGKISVESQVGVGTRFYVEIPAEPCEAPAVQVEPALSEMPMLSGHILLADDNPDLRDLIELYLTRQGLHVNTAENGQDAVRRALHDNPDLILMDLEMPVLGGVGAIDQLRTLGYTGVILALSGHSSGAETARALAAGCNGTVSKPVNREALLQAIATHLPQAGNTSRVA